MSTPNPALVAQRAVQRLPRIALLLFCAAYVVPGVFGRDPWKSADIAAFGAMVNVAQGRTDWLSPEVGGVAVEIAPLPYALGALFIRVLQPLLEPSLAARIPFALLLVATLVLTWYASFHLARTDAAQPLPFAFGGEANMIDYARTIADGAVLAVIATLGLLQLGHETTPELAQLAAAALFRYGLAASPYRCCSRSPSRPGCTPGAGASPATHRRRTWRCCCACSPGSPGRPGRWRCGPCGAGTATGRTGTSPCP